LRSGDIIEKIDDESLVGVMFAAVTDCKQTAVTDLFTGPIGSMAAVNLTLLRPAPDLALNN